MYYNGTDWKYLVNMYKFYMCIYKKTDSSKLSVSFLFPLKELNLFRSEVHYTVPPYTYRICFILLNLYIKPFFDFFLHRSLFLYSAFPLYSTSLPPSGCVADFKWQSILITTFHQHTLKARECFEGCNSGRTLILYAFQSNEVRPPVRNHRN